MKAAKIMQNDLDLESMPDDMLAKIQSEAAHELAKRQEAKRETVKNQIVDLAKSLGVPATSVAALLSKGRKKRVQMLAKYRNPDDHGVTWSGQGREPQWIKEHGREKCAIE